MPLRTQDRGVLFLVGLLLVALVATGIAALSGAGRLDVKGSLGDGGLGDGTAIGVSLDTTALIDNETGGPIRLLSAEVIRVRGFAAPTLSHLSVANVIHDELGKTTGWPPDVPTPVGPFRDVTVGPGMVNVIFGISSQQPGVYGIFGIRIAYRVGARTGHVSGGPSILDCVDDTQTPPDCSQSQQNSFAAALPA